MSETRISGLWVWIILVVIVVLVGPVTASGKVIYVDDDASLGGNGQNWATPYRYLQDALAAAVSGDEIRVVEGIYKPDEDSAHPNGTGSRTATFQLKNGVVITGGYAGFGEPQPDAWDIDVYETLLSGDLLDNDGPDFANNGENSYNVVTGSGANATAVLDGFTITGGNANGGSDIPVGVISHWKFDEAQGSIAYDSAGNNHGNVYGAQWTTGQIGGALDFDGFNDYVDCGNNASLNINAKVTITVWVNTNDAGNFQHNPYVTKGDRSYAIKHYMDNSLQFFIYDGEWNVAWFGVDSSFNGFWHHLAGTYDGSSLKLYVDGQLRRTTAHVGPIASSEYNVNIGRNAQATSRSYDGLIDEVAIYNRALSAGEIQELYSSIGEGRNYGGGMYNESGNPTLINCTFSDNLANYGGGMFNDNSSPTITNCTFSNNSGSAGGGMFNLMSNSTVTNCTFSGNSAVDGGGMYNYESSSPTVTNCTLSGNSAVYRGGGIANFGDSSPTLANCILWGNTASEPQIYRDATSWVTVSYSDVQNGWPGIGNINANPLFVDPAFGDYRLLLGSPCIDAGDNSAVPPLVVTDLNGNPRIIDGTVDMGAYEGPYQGFLLSAESVIVPEGGTATFTVMLAADPFETVEVTTSVESGDPDITVESGGLLTFDSTNYSQPRTVTLTAALDADQLHGTTVILVSATGVYPASITAYELDSEGPTVLYVDCDARGAIDGSSWENAFTDLREGLSFAAVTFWVKEIRVAQGAYTPEGPLPGIGRATNPNPTDRAISVSRTADLSWTAGPDVTSHDVYFGTTSPPPFMQNQTGTTFDPGTMHYSTTYYWCIDELNNGSRTVGTVWSFLTVSSPPPMGSNESLVTTITVLDRTATFQLKSGVTIKGGYAGVGEPDPNERDIDTYKTILSGDLLGNDGPDFANNYDNSYHVVTGSGTNATAVLDGLTITGGNANGSLENGNGGGMYNWEGSPTVTNCTFTGNAAQTFGGGMLNRRDSSPTLNNCVFRGNLSDNHGGGMSNVTSNPTLTNCTFSGNRAVMGGGMFNFMRGDPTLTNCTFSGNTAIWYGGGMRNKDRSSPTLTNCTFSRNAVTGQGGSGGGMRSVNWSSPTLTNCTFAANSATYGRALACGSYQQSEPSNLELTNCILWDGGNEIWNEDNSVIRITYSDVQGGWAGTGNINANPLFVDSAIGNFHLLSDSPCIDAGTNTPPGGLPTTDMDGNPRVIGGRIDMGAYEFNHIPVADAGPDRTVEAQAHWGATVTLDGSGSSDADSTPGTIDDINDFNWYQLDPCDPNADVFLGNGEILDCNLSIGEHIILLEVIDRAGASDTNEVTIIVQDTTPPDIICPPDVTLECPADTTPSATGKATATDTCGAVTITHSDQWQPSCGNAGTLARTWTATDESGNSSTCVQTITVVDTTPPVITCPADVTLQCPADTSVEANGSASAVDTCGSATVVHSDEWQPACGNTGILTRTWSATDECGNSSSCVQTLTVVDTTPPDFELSVSPTMLWPPDHKMVLITPSWTVSDDCDSAPQVSLVSIVANEGDDTVGDGHTTNDIQINEDGSIYLRSERSGTGNDRIYTITYQAVDDCGNTTVRSATVSIPHDFKVLARIASRWLWAGSGRIPEDLNGDGFVNLKDIAIFANNWIQ